MTESTFSYTGKLNGQDLFTVRGNSVAEFKANLNAAIEAISEAQSLQALLVNRPTGNAYAPNMEQAIQALQDAGMNPQPTSSSPQSIEVVKDKYGNDGMIVQSISKQARQEGKRGPILGNYVEMESKQEQQPKKSVPLDNLPDDDIPF